jgi:formate dehydrogenase
VPGTFLGRRVYTPDRKVALAPPAFVEALGTLDSRLAATLALDRGDTLLLFTKREKTSHNSWLHNVESLVRGRRSTNYAYLHPDDARARGIVAGSRIRVHNAWGEIELPARLDAGVMPGAIAIPHGWGHARATSLRIASATGGADVNRLAPDGPEHTERLAGMTHLTGIPVRVEPAPTP